MNQPSNLIRDNSTNTKYQSSQKIRNDASLEILPSYQIHKNGMYKRVRVKAKKTILKDEDPIKIIDSPSSRKTEVYIESPK
jgi:hypothetical protein